MPFDMPENNAFEIIKEKISNKQISIKKLAEDTGISTERIYKWVSPSKKASPKAEDYKVLEDYLSKMEVVPNQQPQINQDMDSAINQDWKQAHEKLLNSHDTLAQSHLILSKALDKMTELLKEVRDVNTNLNTAVKDQMGYHAGIVAHEKVMEGALEKLLQLPEGQLSQKADTLLTEHLQRIAQMDSVGT